MATDFTTIDNDTLKELKYNAEVIERIKEDFNTFGTINSDDSLKLAKAERGILEIIKNI